MYSMGQLTSIKKYTSLSMYAKADVFAFGCLFLTVSSARCCFHGCVLFVRKSAVMTESSSTLVSTHFQLRATDLLAAYKTDASVMLTLKCVVLLFRKS